MQLPPWLKDFFAVKDVDQTYRDDRRYTYILILLITGGIKFNRTYSTSSPLDINHRVVLAPGKAFVVTHIVHVTYDQSDGSRLTRPTTFVHAAVAVHPESSVSETELSGLGFEVTKQIFPYTLH